jgi:hypothetical protein
MCLRTFVASDCQLPQIPPNARFAVYDVECLDRSAWEWEDDVRRHFTKPFVYYVKCAYCGCELQERPIDPVWEDDLDTWLQREYQETLAILTAQDGKDCVNPKQLELSLLDEERSKRHSRRLFWEYLIVALDKSKEIEVYGCWAGSITEIRKRRTMTLEQIGMEGVEGHTLVTVIPNS